MDELTYERVKSFINEQYHMDLNRYKEKQMHRRLSAWLRRSRVSTWTDYFQMVRTDPEEEKRFRDYLTINVTAFFRDPERWKSLETEVMPLLLSNLNGSSSYRSGLKIWSAGCSIGAEPYTLAMLLERISPGKTHDILATDFDRGALDQARVGGPYPADIIKHISEVDLKKYFRLEGKSYFVKQRLREAIRFAEGDLLSGTFETDFDLIVCRNVVIYFTREIKEELYLKFHQSLKGDGVLFLGGTEIIPQSRKLGFTNIGGSVYKKIPVN